MDWISVIDAPLIYTSPTGAKYPTEQGKGRFLCAVPYKLAHPEEGSEIGWWISFVTLYDDCSIHEIGFDHPDVHEDDLRENEYEYLNYTGHDITHYIPEPEPPTSNP